MDLNTGASNDHWLELLAISILLFYFTTRKRGRSQPRVVLCNKAVLITGCDSGFGHELAKRLDGRGMTVFAGCLSPEGEGATQLRKKCSNKLQVLHLDVTQEEHVLAAVKNVQCVMDSECKELWAVVNNAGVATYGETEWTPTEVFQKMYDVNALGPVRVTKAFLPFLRKTCGRIIFVTSLAGYHTFPGVSAYSMSKHAVVSLADALRRELRTWGISVHTVSPTLYKTNISKVLMNDVESYWSKLSENVRNDYTELFFIKYKGSLRNGLKRSRPESCIHEVVNDMEDAVTGISPKSRYVPGLPAKLYNWLMSHTPLPLLDLALCHGMPHAP